MTRPRGRHPARVYWVRRALVVLVMGVVSSLAVFGLATLLGTDSGGPAQARQAAATPRAAEPAAADEPSADVSPSQAAEEPMTRTERRAARRAAAREAAQGAAREGIAPVSQGPCEPRMVRISSRVADAFAATDITVPLDVITLGVDACTWEFSADTVALDITSGDDRIWTSIECPGQLPREELLLVPGKSTPISFTWNSQRSDRDCSRAAGYAYPGWYHVLVAAQGGEPYDQQFELTKAPDEVRTRTPKPKPRKDEPAEQPSSQTQAQTETDTEDGAQGRTQTSGRDGD